MKIYIDENLPHQLAEGLEILERPNQQNIEVLSISKVFGMGCADEDWIPLVGEENALVITQDLRIRQNSLQRQLYKKHGVGLILFKPPSKKGYSYWEMVKRIVDKWEEIKKIGDRGKRPFTWSINVNGKIEQID